MAFVKFVVAEKKWSSCFENLMLRQAQQNGKIANDVNR